MRICVEKGFHRKTPDVSILSSRHRKDRLTTQAVRQAYPVAAEVNSRIFWSIYTLDRLVSITLGRPMAGFPFLVVKPVDVLGYRR
jgi:hypothetical protein